jgi:DNA-binding CsgD family transcriptional regulator
MTPSAGHPDHRDNAEPTFRAAIIFPPTGDRDLVDLINGVLRSASPDAVSLAIVASGSRQAITDLIDALSVGSRHADKPSVPGMTTPNPGFTNQSPSLRQPQCSWADLTKRERAVAQLAGQALTNRQIARRLHITPHTVNYHLRRVFQKLNIESRVRLAAYVLRPRQPPQ